jgi:hypothetical protein
MQLTVTAEALKLARERGGAMAIDFIPPLACGGRAEVSVVTDVRRKNLARYSALRHGDVDLYISAGLWNWAKWARVDVRRGLLGRSFDIEAEHRHSSACGH